jgi:hypothetical protein
MSKWRLLTAGCSLVLVCWGIIAFIDHNRSVGATGDSLAGWVYTGLGTAGLATLGWSRFGYLAAAVELAAAVYAVWWCVLAFAIWRSGAVTNLGFIAPLILSIAVPTLLLCGANAVGTWQIARRTRRCT